MLERREKKENIRRLLLLPAHYNFWIFFYLHTYTDKYKDPAQNLAFITSRFHVS